MLVYGLLNTHSIQPLHGHQLGGIPVLYERIRQAQMQDGA